ncbi:isochorismatase family protein [Streptomyces sp. Lzd4kr]|nr:isochorismatase family protein [Streptomyces sp. Lzd4kr]
MQFTAGIPVIEPYLMPLRRELPKNAAPWSPNPSRAVLLVHDMQRFFVRRFPVPEPRGELLLHCGLLRSCAASFGIPVAYSAQPGGMTRDQRGLLHDFWGPGMTADPLDRKVVDPLAPMPGNEVFTKSRYSAFAGTGLLDSMREQGKDQLIICGVYAHVGILATALDALTHDIETFVVADAVADFSREFHLLALNYAAGRCAAVLPAGELLAQLHESSRATRRGTATASADLPVGTGDSHVQKN